MAVLWLKPNNQSKPSTLFPKLSCSDREVLNREIEQSKRSVKLLVRV
jgi:hypothetical protein